MPTLVGLSLVSTYHKYIPYIIGALLVIIAIIVFIKITKAILRLTHNASFQEIDEMDGIEFEVFVAKVLRANGYSRVRLTNRYDYGIDILARKNGVRWGIQVKRNHGQVKVDAVRQAVTGLNMYNCDRAMVITNSYFGRYATTLAKANDCVLVDRSRLYRLMC